jgi:hypothetical protein
LGRDSRTIFDTKVLAVIFAIVKKSLAGYAMESVVRGAARAPVWAGIAALFGADVDGCRGGARWQVGK